MKKIYLNWSEYLCGLRTCVIISMFERRQWYWCPCACFNKRTWIHSTTAVAQTLCQRLGIHTFGKILFQTKMGDENGAEGNPDVLASLFTVTTKKAAPQYDYSSVPSRCGLPFALIPNYHFGLFHQGFA